MGLRFLPVGFQPALLSELGLHSVGPTIRDPDNIVSIHRTHFYTKGGVRMSPWLSWFMYNDKLLHEYKDLSFWPNTIHLESSFSFENCHSSWGCGNCITTQLLPLPPPAMSLPPLHKCWFQANLLLSILHTKVCLRVRFLGNPICIVNMLGNTSY